MPKKKPRASSGNCKTVQLIPPSVGTVSPFESRERCGPGQNANLRLLVAAACVAMGAAGMLPQKASAANYTAFTETELRNAITAANANGDPSSTITLTGDIAMASATAFPTATKALTIDTNGHSISGFDRPFTGTPNSTAGGHVAFNRATVINSGALIGGDAEQAGVSTGIGGTGLLLTNGAMTNNERSPAALEAPTAPALSRGALADVAPI